MANALLPLEERNLTPDQVEALDKRRDLGHTFLVIAGQFSVIATILLLWVGPVAGVVVRLVVGLVVRFGDGTHNLDFLDEAFFANGATSAVNLTFFDTAGQTPATQSECEALPPLQ